MTTPYIDEAKTNPSPLWDDHPAHHNLLADAINGLVANPVLLNVRDFGIRDDARFLTGVSTVAGSRVVTYPPGGLTGAEVGWMFEIISAGAPDSNPQLGGHMNWQGTVTAVNPAANTFTADALPPANTTTGTPSSTEQNRTQGGYTATVGQPVEANGALAAVWAAVADGMGTTRVRFPAGKYVTRYGMQPPSGTLIEGDGQDRTIIQCFRQAPGIKATGVHDVGIRDLTVIGPGPDGRENGIGNHTGCIDIVNSAHVIVERVTAKNSSTGFAARMQGTFDVVFRDCRADNIIKSNGTYGPASTGGIGFWVYNCSDVHLDHPIALNCDRHGIYFDPGTGAVVAGGDAPDQHGFLNHCSGVSMQVYNTCREGSGLGIGLAGCRLGVFSDLSVNGAGLLGTPVAGSLYAPWVGGNGYGNNVTGLGLQGDQHGEYSLDTLVTGVLLRELAGLPINIQGARCTVRGIKIVEFNRSQDSAKPVIQFDSHGSGMFASNVLPVNDVVDNWIDGLDIVYSGNPALFSVGIQFVGSGFGPDGSGGLTRQSSTLRNRVANARLVSGTTKPATQWYACSGGATFCPSEGPNGNWAGEGGVGDQNGTWIRQLAVQAAGQTLARYRQRADGRQEWGDGTTVQDTNLYRSGSNALRTDDKFLAALGLGVGNSVALGGTPAPVGPIIRKLQVFDENGTSIGYVALYGDIV